LKKAENFSENSGMAGSRARAEANLKWQPSLQPVPLEDQVWMCGKYTRTFKNSWLGDKANNKKRVRHRGSPLE
jgi:hypothetical protein